MNNFHSGTSHDKPNRFCTGSAWFPEKTQELIQKAPREHPLSA